MSKIIVIGGTGFAGEAIVKEAAKRGHSVTSLSRTLPEEQITGVTYLQGSALDGHTRTRALENADIVVGTVSPRGDMAGQVAGLYEAVARETALQNSRFVIIGGFSSLRPAADKPRFFESGSVPAEYLQAALEIAGIFDSLKQNSTPESQWVFISPAAVFGAYATVADTGTYHASNDVALFDDNGESKISGTDFALGVVDEIESAKHNHENISFAQ